MFKLHMGNTPTNITEEEYRELGATSEGYRYEQVSHKND